MALTSLVSYFDVEQMDCHGRPLCAAIKGVEAAIGIAYTALSKDVEARRPRRRKGDGNLNSIALQAALAQIGVPTFVLDESGRWLDANPSGKALLDGDYLGVSRALCDAARGHAHELPIDLVSLRVHGTPVGWLASYRPASGHSQFEEKTARAAVRWRLTPRQREVLILVTRGLANATIAALLEVGERAVELHLTAIYDKAGVESRSALVARVLTL